MREIIAGKKDVHKVMCISRTKNINRYNSMNKVKNVIPKAMREKV